MKRVVAVIVAIGLIVAAVFIRRAIDDEGPTAGGPDGSTAGQPGSTVAPTGQLLCASELGAVCGQLGERVKREDLAVTMARIAKEGRLGADGWLVARPWPELANYRLAAEGRARALDAQTVGLASTPLAFYLTITGAVDVGRACPSLDWKCLLVNPSSVSIAFDDPNRSTAGMLSILQQAATVFASTEFSRNDFSRFDRELARLKSASRLKGQADSLAENAASNFAAAQVVTALQAPATELLARSQYVGKAEQRPALPPLSAELVLVAAAGQKLPVKSDEVKAAVAKAGYSATSSVTVGLPDADVLDELLKLWNGLQ